MEGGGLCLWKHFWLGGRSGQRVPRVCQELSTVLRDLWAFPGGAAPPGPGLGPHPSSGQPPPDAGSGLRAIWIAIPSLLASLWPNEHPRRQREHSQGFVQISAWPHPFPGRGHLQLTPLFLHLQDCILTFLCKDAVKLEDLK